MNVNEIQMRNFKGNIIEAYIQLYTGHLVILISGMSGSGKSKIAQELAKNLKLGYIDTNKFCDKNYNKKVKLPNGEEIVHWDNDDIYNWDKINDAIKKQMSHGVVVTGVAFPKDKITVHVDIHIQIKLNKQNLLERRSEYINEHGDDYQKNGINTDKNIESIIINKFTYPYYIDLTSRSNINKFINGNEIVNDKRYIELISDNIFDYVINFVERTIDIKRKQQQNNPLTPLSDQNNNIDKIEKNIKTYKDNEGINSAVDDSNNIDNSTDETSIEEELE